MNVGWKSQNVEMEELEGRNRLLKRLAMRYPGWKKGGTFLGGTAYKTPGQRVKCLDVHVFSVCVADSSENPTGTKNQLH